MEKQQRSNVFLIVRSVKLQRSLGEELGKTGYNVNEYLSAREFLIDRRRHQRGVVIADVRLIGISGIDLANQLAAEREAFPVVLISNYSDIPKAVKSSVDFICGVPTKESVAAAVERTIVPERFQEKALRWAFERLSPRENEILERVLAGMASGEIAQDLTLTPRTIEAHRARINAKTRARDVGELIRMWKAYRALQ